MTQANSKLPVTNIVLPKGAKLGRYGERAINSDILNAINATLGNNVNPSSKRYANSLMEEACAELAQHPRKGQLHNRFQCGRSFTWKCKALAAAIPASHFPTHGSEPRRFFKGLLEFLGAEHAAEIKDAGHSVLQPTVTTRVSQEDCLPSVQASIEEEIICIDSDNPRSSSDSESDSDATPLPFRPQKGKGGAFCENNRGVPSSSGSDGTSSSSSSDGTPSPPRTSFMASRAKMQKHQQRAQEHQNNQINKGKNQKNTVSRTDQSVNSRATIEASTPIESNGKKRARDSEPGDELPVLKRRVAEVPEHNEDESESESESEEASELDQPIPPGPPLKKRNAYQMVNEELQEKIRSLKQEIRSSRQEIRFFKQMFKYGAGISEANLLAYKARVQKMGQYHKTAWDVMIGKKNADHAARKASGAHGSGTTSNRL